MRAPSDAAGRAVINMKNRDDNKSPDAAWMSIEEAAGVLRVPTVTFRRAIERSARRTADGSVEARVDGVRARKFGRLWRVWLDPGWTKPAA